MNNRIEEINAETIEAINRLHNEDANPWTRKDLLEMTYSSYFYYDDVFEQMSSVFRNLIKNHPFNNANKRTAAIILLIYLQKLNLTITDDFIVKFCNNVINNDLNIDEIADELKNNVIKIQK